MIKSEDVIAALDKQKARLEKLAGEELAGFALIIPPEGDAIDIVVMETPTSVESFYQRLRDRLIGLGQPTNSSYGAVQVPGMRR